MMKNVTRLLILATIIGTGAERGIAQAVPPIGPPGLTATYALEQSDSAKPANVIELTMNLGPVDKWNDAVGQWLHLNAVTANGSQFRLWLLSQGWPSSDLKSAQASALRYVLQSGEDRPVEYRHRLTTRALLPTNGAWPYLLPRPFSSSDTLKPDDLFPPSIEYLGHQYVRRSRALGEPVAPPAEMRLVTLRPDVLTGLPHNTRQADETRRFDDSEYEYIPLTPDDYAAMIDAGLNCFNAPPDNLEWPKEAGVFYWGVGGKDIVFPDDLYNPLYIGPALFLNEPAVVTRDHVLRPRLAEDPLFRKSISPAVALDAFKTHYAEVIETGTPTELIRGLAAREDVDLGSMSFDQTNVYSWETMISSAAHQLLFHPDTPDAIVFEPPGHVGTRRLLPDMNMNYGCQIPVTGSDHFIDIIIGFLRGAARASDKEWGISIYGSVERGESPAFLTRAYDLGATRFFYWDNARLACVPFSEVLALTRVLREHAKQYPNRDLERLRNAADVVILLPPGYNLGHVYMGKGILWGITELNLERRNSEGHTYRTIMGNAFTEIERCLRLGIAFDLLWDLPAISTDGYREIVRVREDGKVEIIDGTSRSVLDGPRMPERPEGASPQLALALSTANGKAPFSITATAQVREGSAPVYYSREPDAKGVHHNQVVAWELYGPEEEDYTCRVPAIVPGTVTEDPDRNYEVNAEIRIDAPGTYRLRAATTDLAGRSAVVWNDITATE
ncbi:MAG: hypothetical protein KJ060_19600 [Candidatus Hydrogenedentes bacterium]|nr:hypothetical protein [Candidatus Hydrogenedentota bacterium]